MEEFGNRCAHGRKSNQPTQITYDTSPDDLLDSFHSPIHVTGVPATFAGISFPVG